MHLRTPLHVKNGLTTRDVAQRNAFGGSEAIANTPAAIAARPPGEIVGPAARIPNLLTRRTAPPAPRAPLPSMTPPAPRQNAAPSAAAAGQEQHVAISKAIAAGKMSDVELATRMKRFVYMIPVLRNLLELPNLTHADVVEALSQAIRDGEIPPDEAQKIMAEITTNPADLRAEMLARYKVSVHGAIHMAGEIARREKAKTGGGNSGGGG